jgi:hypothetical protein
MVQHRSRQLQKKPKLRIHKEIGLWWTKLGGTVVGVHSTGADAIASIDKSGVIAMAAFKGALRKALEEAKKGATP